MTLEHRYLVGERGADQLHLLPTFVAGPDGELRPNPEAARLDARNARDPGWRGRPRHAGCAPRAGSRPPSCSRREAMLPAIAFVFSRKGCDQAVEQCLAAGLRLTEPRRARPASARSPTPRPPASPTTTSTCSATTSGWPGSRRASPPTTRGWCRR